MISTKCSNRLSDKDTVTNFFVFLFRIAFSWTPRLTGFKIDIKSETQAREAGDFMDYEEDYEDDALTEDELNLDEDFEDTAYDESAEDESYEYEEDEFAGEEDSEND